MVMWAVQQSRPGRPPATRAEGDEHDARVAFFLWRTSAPRGVMTELLRDGETVDAAVSTRAASFKASARTSRAQPTLW